MKKLSFFLLLMAFFAPLAMMGQQTLTINGTNTTTNSYVPFYGLYADYGTISQFIIPASDIRYITAGSTISKITFYGNQSSISYFGSKAEVQIGEVDYTSFSSTAIVTSGLTTVTSSSETTLTTNASGELEIVFETPYTYQGGNLLISVGGYGNDYKSTSWTGVSKSDNVAIYKNNGSSNGTIPSGSGTAVKFAPKTTFTYTPSTTPTLILSPNEATVLTGFTETLTASTLNVSGTPAITFTSSNTNVATVSGSGTSATVTAVASGTATITASMTYNGTVYTATCAITVEAPFYCEPSFSDPSDDYISNFVTTGGTTNISNTSTYESNGYSDYYSTQSASIDAGETLSFTVTPSSTQWNYGHGIWVDWNKDYKFTSDERVAYTTSTATGDWTASFEVPDNTPAGDYRMRVIHYYNNIPTDACMNSQYGEAEDYKLTVISSSNCPTPAITNITATFNSATISTDSEASSFNVRYREYVETTPTTYDFEDGWQGWTTFQGSTMSPHSWMHNAEYEAYDSNGNQIVPECHSSSSGMMLSESYISAATSGGSGTAVTPDNYLVSPQIRLGGSFSFYAAARMSNYPAEKFSVLVSTTGNTSASYFTQTELTVTLSDNSWNEYTVDLSAYSGMGYVAIRHYDCEDQHLLYIDDVTIVGPSTPQWQTANNLTITGLEPATTYEAQVQANCGDEDGQSAWSDVATFTTFEVPAVPVESITVNSAAIEMNVGATYSIVFSVLPADATNPAVTFSSDDETVATVDEDGDVTGVAAGTATITIAATDGSGVTGTLSMTVTNIDVEEITANDIRISSGETATINYIVLPPQATNTAVTFSSANPAIATVDANGVVTGVGAGETTITIASVQNPDVTFDITVTVEPDTNTPQLVVNANNITATTAIATWTACDDVTAYTLQLASDIQFTSLIAEYTVSGTSYEFTGLTPNTIYYARVKGDSGWSYIVEFETPVEITLADNATDNASVIKEYNGVVANVTLGGRKLWKNGYWNTLCLPFDLTAAQVTAQLAPTKLKELDLTGTYEGHSTGIENSTLYLIFKDATSISAGVPYIVRWDGNEGDFTEDPVFTNVTIPATYTDADAIAADLNTKAVTFDMGKFVGSYDYQSFTTENKSILFLGSNNKLYYPKPDLTDTSNPIYPSIGAFRAYFQLDGIEAGEVREARLFFGNSEATGIKDVERSTMNVQRDDAWFMLDGMKLQGKPTKKGLYIRNGRKVVVQ